MTVAAGTVYPSIDAFYLARGGRHSGECDFGVWWTGARRWTAFYRMDRGPRSRVSVVHDTGDVYARNFWDNTVELLGTIGLAGCRESMREPRHGPSCPYQVAERVLEGWVDAIHEPDSLAWVRERLASE